MLVINYKWCSKWVHYGPHSELWPDIFHHITFQIYVDRRSLGQHGWMIISFIRRNHPSFSAHDLPLERLPSDFSTTYKRFSLWINTLMKAVFITCTRLMLCWILLWLGIGLLYSSYDHPTEYEATLDDICKQPTIYVCAYIYIHNFILVVIAKTI